MKQGQFLEMLVECLQRLLANEGMVVTRNRKYYSEGMQIGEVDVLVEGRLGALDVAIAIECRDRNQRQDRAWIQQIIGRRADLAEFGITHWFAVSAGGFTATARQLARKANIILIVPGRAEPTEPNTPGFHQWAQWVMAEPDWTPTDEGRVVIQHDADDVLEQIQDTIAREGLHSIQIRSSASINVSLEEVIDQHAKVYLRSRHPNVNLDEDHFIELNDLKCVIEDIEFDIIQLSLQITPVYKEVPRSFRIMAFLIPDTKTILGLIGINEYQSQNGTMYLMIGIRPGDQDNAIAVLRDAEGNPVSLNAVRFAMPTYPPDTPMRTIRIRSR